VAGAPSSQAVARASAPTASLMGRLKSRVPRGLSHEVQHHVALHLTI
jgi:hypothetical protein